jgi:hypothetical protein
MEYVGKCSTNMTMVGDEFTESDKIVFFVFENSNTLECYEQNELFHWFTSQSKLYYWPVDLRDQRVYKLSYSGIFVDHAVFDQVINVGFKAVFLYKKHEMGIGSTYGVSHTHGEVYPIYSGIPVSVSRLNDLTSLKNEIRGILPGKSSIQGRVDRSQIRESEIVNVDTVDEDINNVNSEYDTEDEDVNIVDYDSY